MTALGRLDTSRPHNEAFSCSRIAVAPMMDWTDRHCRYFMRLLSPSAVLYTEMVTAAAIVHGDADRFLHYNKEEHPIALQLGGSEPDWMAQATAKASGYTTTRSTSMLVARATACKAASSAHA